MEWGRRPKSSWDNTQHSAEGCVIQKQAEEALWWQVLLSGQSCTVSCAVSSAPALLPLAADVSLLMMSAVVHVWLSEETMKPSL